MVKIYSDIIKKRDMVNGINDLIQRGLFSGLKSVRYELWQQEDFHPTELIIVGYPGGAYCVRDNTANSVAETLRTIANLVYGGYYDEVRWYKSIQNDPEWRLIDIDAEKEKEEE